MTEDPTAAAARPVEALATFDRDAAAAPLAPVHELVRKRAAAQPDAPAVDGLSYQELDSWAEQIAWRMAQCGVPGGAPVAVRLPTGVQQVAALLGVLKAGCFLVPLSPTDPVDRCAEIVRETKAACVLVESDHKADEFSSWYSTVASGPVLPVPALDGDTAPAGSTPVGVSPSTLGSDRDGLDTLAYVVHTSGTTGRPKGIVQSHRGLAQLVLWMGTEFQLGTGRRIAQWASPNYDASLCEIFATLVAGGTVCPVPSGVRFDAGLLVDWLAAERVNLLQTVPSFGRELRHAIESAAAVPDLTPLDHILFAGEPLPGDLAAGLASAVASGVRLVNLYGTTETILASWMEVTGRWPGTVPIGRPIPGRSILVLDSADRPCPIGVIGEIVVCSPYLALGYVGEAAGSSGFGKMVVADDDGSTREVRCYRTGDQGCWRADGLLEFHGRRDRQVKLRGIRVELAEIETALLSHPSVVDCVVVPFAGDGELVEQLVAYVVPASASGTPGTWRAHLRRQLGDELLPSAFVSLATLPRNAGGKVDASRLPPPGGASRASVGRMNSSSRRGAFRSWSAGLGRVPGAGGADSRPL
jgi:(S)-beta-tyrosine adenylation enzyme